MLKNTSDINFSDLIQPVAEHFFGEPNPKFKGKGRQRWGNNGSFQITFSGKYAGRWNDYSSGEKGGVVDLIERETGLNERKEQMQWLSDNGFIPSLDGAQANPEQRKVAALRRRESVDRKTENDQAIVDVCDLIEQNDGQLDSVHEQSRDAAQQRIQTIREAFGLSEKKAKSEYQQIIDKCYEHKALMKHDGLQRVADDLNIDPDYVQSTWLKHWQKQAFPLHQASPPAHTFKTMIEAEEYIQNSRKSVYLQAPLGSGKTELAKRLVDKALSEGRQVIAITALRSVTSKMAVDFNIEHYKSPLAVIDACGSVSTTIHSVMTEKIIPTLMKVVASDGLVIFDEAAMNCATIADANPNAILSGEKKRNIIDILEGCKAHGIQVVALDGDVTLVSATACHAFDWEVIKCTEQKYPQPKMRVWPQQYIEELKAGNKPLFSKIIESKADENQTTIIGCTTKQAAKETKELFDLQYDLHADNNGEAWQKAFLMNPQQHISSVKSLSYSPTLGAGFSVIHPVRLFASMSYASLQPQGVWQLLRRFRTPNDNTIDLEIGLQCQRALSTYIPDSDIEQDTLGAAQEFYGHASSDPLNALQMAYLKQKNLSERNPMMLLIGHLLNSGIEVEFCYSTETDGMTEAKASRKAVKIRDVDAVLNAEKITDIDAERLSKADGSTEKQAAQLDRYNIEQGLALEPEEFDVDIIEQCLQKTPSLLTKVERQLLISKYNHNIELDNDSTEKSFALKANTRKQVETVLALEAVLNGGFNANDAVNIVQSVRNGISTKWHLMTKPPAQPKKGVTSHYKRGCVNWIKHVMNSWGYSIRSDKTGGNQRTYFVSDDLQVLEFSKRRFERDSYHFKNRDSYNLKAA